MTRFNAGPRSVAGDGDIAREINRQIPVGAHARLNAPVVGRTDAIGRRVNRQRRVAAEGIAERHAGDAASRRDRRRQIVDRRVGGGSVVHGDIDAAAEIA